MQSVNNIVKDIGSVLKVHQPIEIAFDHPDFMEEYHSRVEKVEDQVISISVPTSRRVPVNTHCWIYYEYKKQRYGLETIINGYESGKKILMVLSRPSEVIRLQRRKHFRVPVDIRVTWRMCTDSGKEEKEFFSGTIENISSGGLLMSTDVEVPLGKELLLFFSLSDEADLKDLSAKVVRGEIIDKKKGELLYEYGIEFHQIDKRLHEAIMRFVFKHLMKLKQLKKS